MSQNGNLPQIGGENKKYLNPPPRSCWTSSTTPLRATNIAGWEIHHEWRCIEPIKKGGFSIAMSVYERVNQLNWPYRVLFIQEWAGVLNGGTVSCTVSYLSVCYKYKVQNQWKKHVEATIASNPQRLQEKNAKNSSFLLGGIFSASKFANLASTGVRKNTENHAA